MPNSFNEMYQELEDIFGKEYYGLASAYGEGLGKFADIININVYCPIDSDKLLLLTRYGYIIQSITPKITKDGRLFNNIILEV